MEQRIFIKTPAVLLKQPAAAQREEEQRDLWSWGLHSKRQALELFLQVERNRQGWGHVEQCEEGAADMKGWICPGQGSPLLLQTPTEKQLLSRVVGLSVSHGGLWKVTSFTLLS